MDDGGFASDINSSHPSGPAMALRLLWPDLLIAEKVAAFSALARCDADDFFLSLKSHDQAELLINIPEGELKIWIRVLPPDDLADAIQELGIEKRAALLKHLDESSRNEVNALLAYEEDVAGGLMNPRFPRLRPDMQINEALAYLRKQAPKVESLRYSYVLDSEQRLLGVLSLRLLFASKGELIVRDLMRTNLIVAGDNMSQEEIKHLFDTSGIVTIPVIDVLGRMKGIITVSDLLEVVEQQATEDIHKLGGSEGFSEPYLKIPLYLMIYKRAVWLVILFVGEMFTATAMGYFESEIEKAVVLALFIPLIISSGGNSGSQASTLVVRALALREVRIRDWWRVLFREIIVGSILGIILGLIGLCRILLWPSRAQLYGEHFVHVGITVALSLIGIVLWGSLSGSMLPFLLKRMRLDPATASAPFVATLVDVSGLVIYFTIASIVLHGVLL